jgi:hypothetical protein
MDSGTLNLLHVAKEHLSSSRHSEMQRSQVYIRRSRIYKNQLANYESLVHDWGRVPGKVVA